MPLSIAQLRIRLTPGLLPPRLGATAINELRGGPETLLRWLETQLGLPTVESHRANCVTEFAAVLDGITGTIVSASMATDRWATASELLSRRDELLLAGWDPDQTEGLPPLVADLALAMKDRAYVFPSVSERLRRIMRALDDGQCLPAHNCVLIDAPKCWPSLWQAVLAKLTTSSAAEGIPRAKEGTALRHAQAVVRGDNVSNVDLDESLRYVQTLSQTAAVEFVAATLAHSGKHLDRTTILCEDDGLAMQLDACLRRYGVPTMGATARSTAHPALQVLPLALALCWEPVDPQLLLDFLTLPICPIPRRASVRLAAALTEQPGLGSAEWQRAIEYVCSPEADADGIVRARIDSWLLTERVPQNTSIPTRLVAERSAAVAQWASGRASVMAAEPEPRSHLIAALHIAAQQAALLGELAQSQGRELTEPQLARLLEEAMSTGVESIGEIESEGGPVRIRSLAQIVDPCHRLIWLGLGTGDAVACRWSVEQLRALANSGVDIDDGTRSLGALRSAEARGLCHVEDSLLAVLLPQDEDKRWHPVWLAIRTMFTPEIQETAPLLERALEQGDTSTFAPFLCAVETVDVMPPPVLRPLWTVDPSLLGDRERVSATELEDRLACPLKWVLRHRADIRPSSIASLPDDFQLKGSFCHQVLERAFNGDENLPLVDEAISRVQKLFDERLGIDAAPLAQPDRYRDRQSLRKELAHATRVLIETLANGGYRIKGIEVEVGGDAFGKPLTGSIDCLVERAGGDEAIIDFKYGGKKYERMIADGKAVQLATYAYSRSTVTGRFPAVAYLVLADGLLYTPSGGPIGGDGSVTPVDGPAICDVWTRFHDAITGAESWLTTDGRIPARPLQVSGDWPDAVRIVLDTKAEPHDQAVCRYCDYQHLCGLKQLT